MVPGGCVRVLSSDKLERIDILEDEAVPHGDPPVIPRFLVESRGKPVIGDVLRSIGVESARIDVGAVGHSHRVRVHDALHECSRGGIAGQGSSLLECGHEDVPVHLALVPNLARVEGQCGAVPRRQADREAVVVAARGLHRSDLEEGARAHRTVRVGEIQVAVHAGRPGRRVVHGTARRPAVLGCPVGTVDLEALHGGGGDAETLVELAQDVVVDQGEADVLVAPALALLGIHLAKQVEASPVSRIAGRRRAGRLRRWNRGGGLGGRGFRSVPGLCAAGRAARSRVLGRGSGRKAENDADSEAPKAKANAHDGSLGRDAACCGNQPSQEYKIQDGFLDRVVTTPAPRPVVPTHQDLRAGRLGPSLEL